MKKQNMNKRHPSPARKREEEKREAEKAEQRRAALAAASLGFSILDLRDIYALRESDFATIY